MPSTNSGAKDASASSESPRARRPAAVSAMFVVTDGLAPVQGVALVTRGSSDANQRRPLELSAKPTNTYAVVS